MQSNLAKKLERIFSSLSKIDHLPKSIIKYGTLAFLLVFAIGTALVVYNHAVLNYDLHLEFVANTLIKNSFVILAEAVIGGLLIDFAFKKN